MAMNQELLQIPEDAPAQLEVGGDAVDGDAREVAGHITGFAGSWLLLDKAVFLATCGFHILAIVFFLLGGAWIWFTTLVLILVVALLDCLVLRLRSQLVAIQDRTIRRFMYGIPLAFFCFYSEGIIRRHKHCKWDIALGSLAILGPAKAGTYTAGLVVVLSMALAALRMDCNGSANVSRRVRRSNWYATCHLLFRFTELSFRLGAGVLLCEGLRVLPLPWVAKVGHPVSLCLPFFALVLVYCVTLQVANQWGRKPSDRAIACVVVGVVTLAMNPMHFFARSGYDSVVMKANKSLFMIRVLEVLLAVFFVYQASSRKLPTSPEPQCDTDLTGLELIEKLGPVAICQVVVSLVLHYLIMALHGEIQHSTCQALTGDEPEGGPQGQMAFARPGQQSLFVPPPTTDAGLGEAWLQLGGGLPLSPVAEERQPDQVDLERYRIVSILGGGSFGVVVKTEVLRPRGGPRVYAMKLLNTSGRNERLAQREAQIYSNIWLEMRELAPGYRRVGHPNIVRLDFWTTYPEAQEFSMVQAGVETVVRHPSSRTTRFHMLLMMEFCEDNLERYLASHHDNTAGWFGKAVLFLAEIQLALAFLHSINVTYRDLKPENVLVVRKRGEAHCKLGDFGYGRVVDPEAGLYQVSVAGSPYFCAPEMEERVRHVPLVANQAEENALDTYSYGTVAFVLGHGPGYIREDPMRMGPRNDHPRSPPVLQAFRAQMAAVDPNGHLADLVGPCMEMQARNRPAVADLRAHSLFQGVDFDALVRQDI